MEYYQVFEVLWRYSTIFAFIIFVLYLYSYVQLNILRNIEKPTKFSIFINELHILSRSIILIYISFILVKYMFLVEIEALEYFKSNSSSDATDFLRYILNVAQNQDNL